MLTLKIILHTSVVGGDYCYAAGEVVDAPEDRAKDLIKAGHASLYAAHAAEKSEKATSKQAEKAEKR